MNLIKYLQKSTRKEKSCTIQENIASKLSVTSTLQLDSNEKLK